MSRRYPIRLIAGLPDSTSQAVEMPRCPSLQGTTCLMFLAPYAPAIYFEDDSYIVFGEGDIARPPGWVRYGESREEFMQGGSQKEEPVIQEEYGIEEEEAATHEECGSDGVGEYLEEEGWQEHEEEDKEEAKEENEQDIVDKGGYGEWYDEGFNQGWRESWQDGHEKGFRTGPEAGYEEGYDKGYDDAYMFFCEEQLVSPDDEEEQEMYVYGSERRNTVWRSKILGVVDPRLSKDQQLARNRGGLYLG
ncbi:hypothetical protein P3342_010600 [Pyrenophora teres f. teres]|nr:hypothetical protein P3342_010600 [Pyrenophora teres f. teres]